jgi:hypothetical protein
MDTYGSDKGPNCKNAGNYTKLYNYLFDKNKDACKYLFEVGLGTNNTDVPSSMGPDGVPGASLRGWRDYFPNATIIGADVDSRILFMEDRIKTHYVDQHNPKTIQDLWSAYSDILFDVIIDDGIHDMPSRPSGNVTLFENSIHKLRPNGYYIIEDVAIDYEAEFVHPNVSNFIQAVNAGYYGSDLEACLGKVPAYAEDKTKPAHTPQMIVIKKNK